MLKSIFSKPYFYLILLIIFHLLGNIIWITINNRPPSWDESAHTTYAIQFSHIFHDFVFKGQFDKEIFLRSVTDFYAPVGRLVGGSLLFIFGDNLKIAQFTGTIFFILTLYAIYMLGKTIFKNSWIGLIASFIFSFYLAVYDNSRWLLLDIPMLFFYLLAVNFFIKSNFFENRKYSLIAFIFIALASLIKIQSLMYFGLFLVYALVFIFKNKKTANLKNMLLGIICMIVIISPWVFVNSKNIITYFQITSKAELIADPTNLLDLSTWFHYLKLFIDYEITFYIFLIFLFLSFFYIRSKDEYKKLLLFTIVFYYILFTIFPNKDMRYLYPILPFTALIFAKGFIVFHTKYPSFSIFLISTVVGFNILLYSTLSFGFPLPKGVRKDVVVPYLRDIAIVNTTDYPVKKFDSSDWPNEKIVEDVYDETQGEQTDLVFVPNYDNFNGNNFNMYLLLLRFSNIRIIRSQVENLEFNSIQSLRDYIDSYQYFIYSPDTIGVFYQKDLTAYQQLQNEIAKMLENKDLILLKEYHLPSGQTIDLIKRT